VDPFPLLRAKILDFQMEAVEAAELAKPVSLVPHIRGLLGSPTRLPTGGPSWGRRDKKEEEENAIEKGNRHENQCEN